MASCSATAGDRYLDYVARPYEPRADWKGKLRSEALFDESARSVPGLLEVKRRLQEGLGKDRVVYGVKERLGRRYWELYVYNYEASPELSIPAVASALPAGWRMDERTPPLPIVMFSFELSEDSVRRRLVDGLHVYTISGEAKRPVSNSYLWKDGTLTSENVYLPMPLDSEPASRLFRRFTEGRVLPAAGVRFDDVVPPELAAECRAACWAFKRSGGALPDSPNSIYLSTLTIDGLTAFLRRFGYPSLSEYAERNRARLDHLLFDVGYDFNAGPRYSKSGFYGVF
jgi:hypothetical protein